MRSFLEATIAFALLIVLSPILLAFCFLIWMQDMSSPFYISFRVGKNLIPFRMIKLRSMIVKADITGVDSTAGDDKRITPVGMLIRKLKLDEVGQLWNIVRGDMSFVGPRPNVSREVALYTNQEKHLLDVKPGITDIASIVFSDESVILYGSQNPDLRYNQIIRPWKSRLGLLYVQNQSIWLDLKIVFWTATSFFYRQWTLKRLSQIVNKLCGEAELAEVCLRSRPLTAKPPPGENQIVQNRF